ncbi:hypothetical protein ABZY20_06410 [Streptomyces sp. NPDC006624]|uniref:hypothetical protein n=1 Tax=Streptomyces sp. NPDC006624 TaxID=3154892 RepID=UPI0033B070CA
MSEPPAVQALPKLPDSSELPVPDLPELRKPPVVSDLPKLPDSSELPVPDLPELRKPPVVGDLPKLPEPSELPVPDLPKLPGLVQVLPGLVTPPGGVVLPGAPGVPGLPDGPALPGRILPAPVTAVPQPGGVPVPSAEAQSPAGRSEAAEPVRAGADVPARVDRQRDARPGCYVPGHHTRRAGHAVPSAGSQPPMAAAQAPGGRPGGLLGNRVSADSGTPRHGDAHAVTPGHRAPMRLLTVVTARGEAAGTQDSVRDIPLFPG